MDEVDERTRQRLERKARRQDLKRQRILAAAQSVVVSEGQRGAADRMLMLELVFNKEFLKAWIQDLLRICNR